MEILMPGAGADVEQSRLLQWCVKPGDEVKHGDLIAIIETARGERFDIKVYEDGMVSRLLLEEGDMAPVGTALAVLDTGRPDNASHPRVGVMERYVSEPVIPAQVDEFPTGEEHDR